MNEEKKTVGQLVLENYEARNGSLNLTGFANAAFRLGATAAVEALSRYARDRGLADESVGNFFDQLLNSPDFLKDRETDLKVLESSRAVDETNTPH